ncbi:AMP-binding protein [Mangrovibacterium lignilyticum]|uniref:AMP-binding protein n=1 Tax=Mangrovibacterium lignilyticum TaxID=2668052 RepID=UPI0013D02E8C|nr:AMP-binding protein [Mangrovibacterium lignilyticum]
MELFPSHITLNGQPTKVESLLANRKSTTDWERDWLDFLSEWYSNDDVIRVNTSGSTGEPKTIELKKDFVAASAMRTIRFFNLNEGDKILHCLPSRFIAGKLMVVRALIGKLDLYVIDPASDLRILNDVQFRFSAMVTNQVEKCFKFGHWQLDFLLLGGSAIPTPLEAKLQTIGTTCYSSYAMTETATHIALRKLNGEGKDAYYHCLEDINISLNETGCVRIKMPGLEHGFLQTNDLGELKDEHTFRILGRADNRIISGGLKFSPEELEQKLEDSIPQAFYISSKPHDSLGQQLVLVVEGNENSSQVSELKNICREKLTKYEQPREIIFVKRLPRTENGKIRRMPV